VKIKNEEETRKRGGRDGEKNGIRFAVYGIQWRMENGSGFKLLALCFKLNLIY